MVPMSVSLTRPQPRRLRPLTLTFLTRRQFAFVADVQKPANAGIVRQRNKKKSKQ